MRHPTILLRAALGAGALALACGASAQEAGAPLTPPAVAAHQRMELSHGDPHRWYKDDATLRARVATLRKEIGAAYAEAKIECQKSASADRASCLREARNTYNQDMSNARETALASR